MNGRQIFPGLLGNERIRSILADDLAAGKSAHAYILEGPRGSGKHTAARLIAASSLCENRGDPAEPLPCGHCTACRKILGGHSVDVMTVSRGDRATLGVDSIREVKESLWVTPNDGERKFYLIEDAHLMTAQAQNALLLSLEEPPPYVMFLLLCEDAALLLETIRSRAPVLKMERFSESAVEDWLTKNTDGANRKRISYAARLSDGALGYAKELYEHGDGEITRYQTAGELARLLVSGKKSEAAVFLPSLPKNRQELCDVLTLTRLALRDMIADKKGGDLLFYSASEGVPTYAKRISARRVVELIRALSKAEDDISANVSANVVMTALLFKA